MSETDQLLQSTMNKQIIQFLAKIHLNNNFQKKNIGGIKLVKDLEHRQ